MSPVILVIVCTSCEKIMQCGCAAALKGTAAWKGSIFGLNREAARNKTQMRSKAASFTSEGNATATVCFGKSIEFLKKTYLNGDLWLWRVLLPSGSDVLAGFMRSPESGHFS